MTRGEVIAKLRKEGFAASVGRVRQALMNGFVTPLPRKTARGAFDYKPRHLAQLRWYFVSIRPGPSPLCAEKIPIRGPQDRVRRLDRQKLQLRERGPSEGVLRRRRQKAADAAILFMEDISRRLDQRAVETPPESAGAQLKPIALPGAATPWFLRDLGS